MQSPPASAPGVLGSMPALDTPAGAGTTDERDSDLDQRNQRWNGILGSDHWMIAVLVLIAAAAWMQWSPVNLEIVCVTATSEPALDWAMSIANTDSSSRFRVLRMTAVLGKSTPL